MTESIDLYEKLAVNRERTEAGIQAYVEHAGKTECALILSDKEKGCYSKFKNRIRSRTDPQSPRSDQCKTFGVYFDSYPTINAEEFGSSHIKCC